MRHVTIVDAPAKKKAFSMNLGRELRHKGKNGVWLSQQANVNKSTIYRYLNGDILPTEDTYTRIKVALDINDDKSLTGENVSSYREWILSKSIKKSKKKRY